MPKFRSKPSVAKELTVITGELPDLVDELVLPAGVGLALHDLIAGISDGGLHLTALQRIIQVLLGHRDALRVGVRVLLAIPSVSTELRPGLTKCRDGSR